MLGGSQNWTRGAVGAQLEAEHCWRFDGRSARCGGGVDRRDKSYKSHWWGELVVVALIR